MAASPKPHRPLLTSAGPSRQTHPPPADHFCFYSTGVSERVGRQECYPLQRRAKPVQPLGCPVLQFNTDQPTTQQFYPWAPPTRNENMPNSLQQPQTKNNPSVHRERLNEQVLT